MSRSAAVVLCSGGLDSTTLLAMARDEARDCYALSFRYGQRHAVELDCARHQAQALGAVAHEIVDLAHLGPLVAPVTALVEGGLVVPKDERPAEGAIPVTYVPARNTLFLSYGLAWAEVVGASEIWIGVNAVDYSGYPDCRPAFIEAFERLANLATKVGVQAQGLAIRLRTPLIDLGKHEIVGRGLALGVDYSKTVSCYDPAAGGLACGRCESCVLRHEGFERAGVADPTRYAAGN